MYTHDYVALGKPAVRPAWGSGIVQINGSASAFANGLPCSIIVMAIWPF
jgi:hypothetical protein